MALRRSLFRQVSIIGLGLIGGSLGMALRRGKVARRVIGFARHEVTVRQAKRKGAIDDGCTELCPEWLGQSDLIVIATPPATVKSVAQQVIRKTRHSFLLTDVASIKDQIVQVLERGMPRRISYVGSHPMAGSEQSGILAARGELFEGAACVVTRTKWTPAPALRAVSEMWKSVGSRVVYLTPSRHDRLVAQISHVPHLVAVALANGVEREALEIRGGGFDSTTRLALSDPEMWNEIVHMNWKEVNLSLGQLIKRLEHLRGKIRGEAWKGLLSEFKAAQRRRQQFKRTGRG